MTISVAVNAVIGIVLSTLYLGVVGYTWRYRRHWYIIFPIANALFYLIPTSLYINRALHGDLELRPVNWGVLLLVLPAIQVGLFLYWGTRDVAQVKAINIKALEYTEEANQRAYKRTLREEKETSDRLDLAAERTAAAIERNELLTERTANATERIADAAEAENNKQDE